jgi:glutamyl-tRNA reductase
VEQRQWQRLAPAPSVLLATCNRVEVYAWAATRPAELGHKLGRRLARAAGVPFALVAPHLFTFTGPDAVLHLVRVVAGLDSLVLGDEQIRGQVRDACSQARAEGALPAPLDGIFRKVLQAGRTIRGGGVLARHPSVAESAIHMLRQKLGPDGVAGETALVLGAGSVAEAAARALIAAGARVSLLNRTPEHAARVATRLGPRVGSHALDALPRLLPEAGILVCATASRRPVVDVHTVADALQARGGRSIFIVDIAVPRDVEPAVRELAGARLLDLDDMGAQCPVQSPLENSEFVRVERLAKEEATRITAWLRNRELIPAIVDLRRQGAEICALELRRAAPRLRDLTDDQRAALDAVTAAIVNKLLHGPTVVLREAAMGSRPAGPSLAILRDVLRLDSARHLRSA